MPQSSESKSALADELISLGFRLGGSRRMAQKYPEQVKVSEDTDYDLYCPDDPKFIEAMTARGFHELNCQHHNYWDDMLLAIWKNDARPEIEILVRKDIEKYTQAFESIGADMYVKYLWKSSPLRDNNISDPIFCEGVKNFFNSLFRLVGFIWTPPVTGDDTPW